MSLAKDEQEELTSPKAILENMGARVVVISPKLQDKIIVT